MYYIWWQDLYCMAGPLLYVKRHVYLMMETSHACEQGSCDVCVCIGEYATLFTTCAS